MCNHNKREKKTCDVKSTMNIQFNMKREENLNQQKQPLTRKKKKKIYAP